MCDCHVQASCERTTHGRFIFSTLMRLRCFSRSSKLRTSCSRRLFTACSRSSSSLVRRYWLSRSRARSRAVFRRQWFSYMSGGPTYNGKTVIHVLLLVRHILYQWQTAECRMKKWGVTALTEGVGLQNHWIWRIVKKVDKTRMDELRVEVGVRECFRKKLVRSWLKCVGY